MNVTSKKTKDFLIVSAVLILASMAVGTGNFFSQVLVIGPAIHNIFLNVLSFVVPSTIVVCLKQIWSYEK